MIKHYPPAVWRKPEIKSMYFTNEICIIRAKGKRDSIQFQDSVFTLLGDSLFCKGPFGSLG